MNYEQDIIAMANEGYISNIEEEQLLNTMLETEIMQRRGL